MKKTIFYALLALTLCWSCNKTIQEIDQPGTETPEEKPQEKPGVPEGSVHTATLTLGTEQDDPDTKGTFVPGENNKLSFRWQEGDQIGVYLTGDGGYGPWVGPFDLVSGAGQATADFQRELDDSQGETYGYVAIYPYYADYTSTPESDRTNPSFDQASNTLTFNLPAKYKDLDNLDMVRIPMVAVLDMSATGDKHQASFKYVGGAVKMTLNNVPSKAKYFKLWAVGKNISGNYTINLNDVGTGTLQGNGSANTVELQLKEGKKAATLDVYFPVPAGTYTLSIGVYGDGIVYLEKTASKENTIGRGQVLKMPAVDIQPNLGAYNENLANNLKASGITYQMNVYSFADSDNDGVGDFKGIENHLDYLDKLGVTAIWLSPCQVAQSYHGYDIKDYTHLNPAYGSGAHTSARAEADFQSLINAAHQHNIRIYMDYVINHTGDAHTWFEDVKRNGPSSPYWDYYAVSADPYNDVHADKIPQIPTSWDVNPYTDNRWWPFVYGAGASAVRYAVDLDWTDEASPTITVSETTEAVTSGGTYDNAPRYLLWGNSTYTQFADNGPNRYRLVLDFQSDWGCLVRTTNDNNDWGAGTKWGFASGKDQLKPGVSHALTSNDAGNILMPDGTLYFYYSAFSTGMMPDLNYHHASDCENSPAFQAIVASVDKWLDMGLDGLRLDAIKHIYGNESGGEGSENRLFWQKFYNAVNTKYQAKAAYRSDLNGTGDANIFMVGEVLSGESDCRPFYAGMPAIFEFQFWWDLRTALNSQNKGGFVSNMIDRYYRHQEVRSGASQPGDAIATPKLSNHDEDRTAYELYEMHRIRQAACVLLTAPGRPFIYQGEELGYWGTGAGGDEYRRAPILWTSDISSAATHGVNDKYDSSMLTPSISVASQAADDESLLTLYRRFAYAKNTNLAMALGRPITDEKVSDSRIMSWYMKYWMSEWNDDKVCLVMHNISEETKTVERYDGENLSTILVSSDPISVSGKYVTMPPYSSVVFALN